MRGRKNRRGDRFHQHPADIAVAAELAEAELALFRKNVHAFAVQGVRYHFALRCGGCADGGDTGCDLIAHRGARRPREAGVIEFRHGKGLRGEAPQAALERLAKGFPPDSSPEAAARTSRAKARR